MTTNNQILMRLATTVNGASAISLTPESIFGRHCAVLGSSGGGKTWTVARLIEEAARYNSKVLLIDIAGEYECLSERTFHIHIGKATREGVKSLPATVPYFELTEADIMTIFEPSNNVQCTKLRNAIRTLKLLHLSPALGTGGTLVKANKLKANYEREMSYFEAQIERRDCIFNIHRLPLQIEYECVEPVRSQSEINYWGARHSSDHHNCVQLINRVEDLCRAPELRDIFTPPSGRSAFEALEKFLTDKSVSVLRISLEFLGGNNRAREIVANALLRHLIDLSKTGTLNNIPVITVLDEAHQITHEQSKERFHEIPMDAFSFVAKEGRKYGLTLCLATQRPRDVPEAILTQMGTFFVHRLIGASDQKTIESASGTLNDDALKTLATLEPGEALLLGAGIREALHIKIIPPSLIPLSHGPDYQSAWRHVLSLPKVAPEG